MATQQLAPTSTGRRPEDAEGFVADATRWTNTRDLEGQMSLWSEDATIDAITDGAIVRATGLDEIREMFLVNNAFAETRGLTIDKTLVAATDDTIVARWEGTIAGKRHSRGLEYWVFDADGKIARLEGLTFLDARPADSLSQGLKLLLASPATALAFVKAQRHAAKAQRSSK